MPLGELLDAADRTTAEPVPDVILTRHPLQAYDPRNLKAGDPSTDPPEWPSLSCRVRRLGRSASTARRWRGRAGRRRLRRPAAAAASRRPAAAAGGRRVARGPGPVPDAPGADPCATGSTCPRRSSPTSSTTRSRSRSTPWRCGRSATTSCASCSPGQDPEAVMTGEQLRGTLPPFRLGERLHGVTEECQRLGPAPSSCAPAPGGRSTSTSTSATGRRLTGTVAGRLRHQAGVPWLLAAQGQAAAAHLDPAARPGAADPDRPGPATPWAENERGPNAPHGAARPTGAGLAALAGRAARRGPEQAAAPADRHGRRVGRGARARPRGGRRREEVGPRRGVGDRPLRRRPASFPRRTRTPTTSGSSAAGTSRCCSTPVCRRYAWQVWEPLLSGGEKVGPL